MCLVTVLIDGTMQEWWQQLGTKQAVRKVGCWQPGPIIVRRCCVASGIILRYPAGSGTLRHGLYPTS